MIGTPRAIVIAFDGLIADTLDQRSAGIVEGIAAIGFSVDPVNVRAITAGHSISEAVRVSCSMAGLTLDETLLDIASLRATRMLSASMHQPVLLARSASEWMRRAALHARIVVRADSERALVEPVLAASGLADNIALVICADDVARAGADVPMIVRAWQLIAERCRTFGVSDRNLHGLECAYDALCTKVTVGRLHRVTSITELMSGALPLF